MSKVVLRRKQTGLFVKATWHGNKIIDPSKGFTDDIQKARVFENVAGAKASIGTIWKPNVRPYEKIPIEELYDIWPVRIELV